MFKTLFFTLTLTFSTLSWSKVEMRWLTVACIVIQDGESTIMFDPMFTRAGVLHWLNLQELRSDEKLVAEVLKEQNLPRVDGVFASHSHFDHLIDAPMVSKLAGATFFTDASSEIVAKAYKSDAIKTQLITNRIPIQIGKFKVTPILRDHSAIRAINFHFLPGPVREDFNFSLYDYRTGDTWFYYIEHPELKIVLDQGPIPHLDKLRVFTANADVLIQGVANRENDEVVENGYMAFLKPKLMIPVHFDNFFTAFDPKNGISHIPGINLDGLMERLGKNKHGTKTKIPSYGEKIVLHP